METTRRPASISARAASTRDTSTRAARRVLVLVAGFVASTGCSASPKPQSVSLALGANAPNASVLDGPGGVRLDVPAHASATDVTIVLTTAPGSRRASSAGAIVATPITLEPEGSQFGKVLELTIPISPSQIPSGKSIDDVVVMTAPQGSTAYVPLPTRRAGSAVVATTTHFSDFVALVPPSPVDPIDPACPIPTTSWSFGGAPSVVRSIAIAAPNVLAAVDSPMSPMPIYSVSIDAGSPMGSPVQIDRPASPLTTHFPRLQVAELGGQPELFVSFLAGDYFNGTSTTEYPGGLVHVGPVASLPATASLLAATTGSVDGVFADVSGPLLLRWSTLTATTAALATVNVGDTFGAPVALTGVATTFERAEPVRAAERLVGFVRSNEDDAGSGQHWTAWPLASGVPGTPTPIPGTFVTFAMHDQLPIAYAVDTLGGVHAFAVDDAFQITERIVAQLPSGYTAATSSAKMVFTSGSVVFPATDAAGALRLVRVHVATGNVAEWIEPDAAATAWSALAAGDGVVCYASSQNVLRCGCVAGTFTPLP